MLFGCPTPSVVIELQVQVKRISRKRRQCDIIVSQGIKDMNQNVEHKINLTTSNFLFV